MPPSSTIGEMIADDAAFQPPDRVGLGMVVTLSGGTRRMTGFRHLADGDFIPDTPDEAGDVMRKTRDLRDALVFDGHGAFVQCLIRLTRPGGRLRLQFVFDAPKRRVPRGIGLDMSEFAQGLRPG
ncbi:hypothetical protein E2F46_14245 [Luteimonas aestuarii]|uniref:Uncharacterized protein n=1 Tax=Luteimonas aestuarii TaxID=453837 RepID=A0A4R5TJC1_9GAMM|nr:hypothetical protein [Luteimonas aestuarii]TDK21699.1 hypothetical protein E2F46_14245 [Luteimonas aestuarii]